jgi:hypothetical protein
MGDFLDTLISSYSNNLVVWSKEGYQSLFEELYSSSYSDSTLQLEFSW